MHYKIGVDWTQKFLRSFVEDERGAQRDPLTIEKLKVGLQKNPNLDFYLYSGEIDVFAPIKVFQEQVETFGESITYRQFSESDHSGFISELKIWQDLRQVSKLENKQLKLHITSS